MKRIEQLGRLGARELQAFVRDDAVLHHRCGSRLNDGWRRECYDHPGDNVGEGWLLDGGFHINGVAAEVLEDSEAAPEQAGCA